VAAERRERTGGDGIINIELGEAQKKRASRRAKTSAKEAGDEEILVIQAEAKSPRTLRPHADRRARLAVITENLARPLSAWLGWQRNGHLPNSAPSKSHGRIPRSFRCQGKEGVDPVNDTSKR
jgi:hypothetical protein